MKLVAERVRINRDGYDRRGKYWGSPDSPLYHVSNDDGIDAYVRAPSSAAARRKVEIQKGLRHETAKEKGYHPLYDRSERLRRAINAASPYGHMPDAATVSKWLKQTERIAATVKAANPGDISWRYVDKDLSLTHDALNDRFGRPGPSEVQSAKGYIHRALESVSGAASRAGRNALGTPVARDSQRLPQSTYQGQGQITRKEARLRLRRRYQDALRAGEPWAKKETLSEYVDRMTKNVRKTGRLESFGTKRRRPMARDTRLVMKKPKRTRGR